MERLIRENIDLPVSAISIWSRPTPSTVEFLMVAGF